MLSHSLRRLAVSVRNKTSRHFCVSRTLRAVSSSDNLSVSLDETTGIATLKLQKAPVNSLNLEFLTNLHITLEKLENERSCRALILTSGVPKIFCAGLDIMEMYQAKPERLQEFWRTLQNVWITLYGSRLTTMAAINGHSPAGGCLLSMSCDNRFMAPNFTIGLNETQLGIIPPFWFIDTMKNVIGQRQTELCCQKGLMLSTEKAYQVGLVDEIVPLDSIQQRAEVELKEWLNLPDFARQLTKNLLRKETIDHLITRRDEDIAHFVGFITKESVQKALGMYLEALKNKQKAKK